MDERRFDGMGRKAALAGALGGVVAVGAAPLGALAQDDDGAEVEAVNPFDFEGTFTDAFVNGGATAISGLTTVNVDEAGFPSIVTVEPEAVAEEDDDEGTESSIEANGGVSVSDASGGDDNFAVELGGGDGFNFVS